MHPALKVFSVFLASPGDLFDERLKAKEVVDELNLSARHLGWRIELMGWEDTTPGYVRPQSKINEQVDACHLFVGMVWRRWGQPPGAGNYQSGFEEEFERAVSRRKGGKEPEIWLFLKDIEPEFLRDPGDQLRLVLAFRAKLDEEKSVFYRQFQSTEEWAKLFRSHLNQHIVQMAAPISVAEIPSKTSTQSERQNADSTPSNTPLAGASRPYGPAAESAIQSLSRISEAVQQGSLEWGRMNDVAPADLARLSILASAFFVEEADELIETHQAQLAYKSLVGIRLTPREWTLSVRSMLADTNDVIPGWRYILPSVRAQSVIFNRILRDLNPSVREGALKICRDLRLRGSNRERKNLLEDILGDATESVMRAAIAWIDVIGSPTDIWFLESFHRDPNSKLKNVAEAAICSVLAKTDKRALFKRLIQTEVTVSESVAAQAIDAVDDDELRRALLGRNVNLRRFAAIKLESNGSLRLDDISVLRNDASNRVREVGIRAAIKRGERITPDEIRSALPNSGGGLASLLSGQDADTDSLILLSYSLMSYDDLLPKLEWYSLDGHLAYRALSQFHFARFGDQVRRDLADEFSGFRERARAALRTKYREMAQSLIGQWANSEEYKCGEFVEAALFGLLEHGTASDLSIVRPYALSENRKVLALVGEFIAKFGQSSDVETVLSVAERSWSNQDRLVAVAFNLHNDPAELLVKRILNGPVRSALIKMFKGAEFRKLKEHWSVLLSDPDANVRKQVVLAIFRATKVAERKKILRSYLANEKYFYNVVCWLDRLSHTPKPWQDRFAEAMNE